MYELLNPGEATQHELEIPAEYVFDAALRYKLSPVILTPS